MLPAGGVSERFDALRAGRGDATLLGPPFDAMALDAGMQRIASVQQCWPDFPGQGLVVSASAMERLRPALQPWLIGLEQARRLMASDPAFCVDALKRAGFPPNAVDGLIAAAPRSLVPDRAGIELLIRQRLQVGLVGAGIGCDELMNLRALPPR